MSGEELGHLGHVLVHQSKAENGNSRLQVSLKLGAKLRRAKTPDHAVNASIVICDRGLRVVLSTVYATGPRQSDQLGEICPIEIFN